MKIIELVKRVERINKENKELGFEDEMIHIQLIDFRSYDISTTKDFKKVTKEFIDNVQIDLLNKELEKTDNFSYELWTTEYNERIKINIYKERLY